MKIERVTRRLVSPARAAEEERVVELSSADFVVPPVHVELVVAYEACAAPQTSQLERALAEVLCAYREWAGRLQLLPPPPQQHITAAPAAATGRRLLPAANIILNDAGAAFLEATAHDAPLLHLLPSFHSPSLLLRDLIPPHFGASELLVQVTRFTCGGITLGVAWHHQVADGEAAMDFMHAWALTMKGLSLPFSSLQDRSLLMVRNPPKPIYEHEEFKRPLMSKRNVQSEKQELVVRKLHFSAHFLQKIKEEAKRGGDEDYTRFESLMGHLWRCITKSRGLEEEQGKENNNAEGETMTRLMVAVNARKRMNPQIPNGYFGNVVCPTCASANISKLIREPLGYAAKLVKEAIKKVDEDYVKSSLDYVEMKERHPFEGRRGDGSVLTPNLSVTSWATLP